MEPFDTIDEIRQLEHRKCSDVERLRQLAVEYPDCPELWDVLGDVMQVCGDGAFPIDESIACYRRAIEVDPDYAPAYESLGYAYDAYLDEFERAAAYFRLAIANGGGDTSRVGLARVLAQQGRIEAAHAELDACVDQQRAEVLTLRREIVAGLWRDASGDVE